MSSPITQLKSALEGRYRVEREIGQGGMATVYLARDEKHNRNVALKVLKPELAAVIGGERFLAEIETTANLQHPHILPLFDSGEASGFLFYVMPFVEGESLRERLDREHQLPVDEAVRIASDVAEALDHAHSAGVIHRDIKPANVLLQAGRPLISDFGIALAVTASGAGRLTETGLSLGTPHYMSPEQATGDLSLGSATDIYSLGCVLYEMLAGEPPYMGSTPQAILGRIIAGEPVSATRARPSTPSNVDAAIRKALEKVPADRFKEAREFAKALADPGFRHHETVGERNAHRQTIWNPLSVVSTVAVVVLLSLAGLSRLGREEAPRIISRFEVTLPQGVQSSFGRLPGDISPDGAHLLFTGAVIGERRRIWLRPQDDLVAVPIPGTEGGENPRFSPDGESVVFIEGGALRTVPISGGVSRTIVADSVSTAGGVAWADDQWLYFVRTGLGIWRVPAAGGEAEEVTRLAEGESAHRWPESLPNGAGLIFSRTRGEGEDDIALLLHRDGQVLPLFPGTLARYAATGHILWISPEGTLLGTPLDLDHPDDVAPGVALVEGVDVDGGGYFALSEGGDLLYRPDGFRRGGTPVWVGRDGSERLVDPGLTDVFRDPAVSPDGLKIAFEAGPEGRREIRVYDAEQGTLTPVTFDQDSRRPFWSIDGQEVGFYSRDAWYSQPVDLSGPARLLVRTQAIGNAWWTPDGGALAYKDRSPGDLFYAAAHPDSTPRPLTNSAFNERAPALSRDGRWLAYHSDESGQDEVYVRPFPGPGGRVRVSRDGGWTPVWSHRGNELFYVRPIDLTMMVATVRSDSLFAVESRRPLMSWSRFWIGSGGRHFDISPDGQEFLALRISEAAPHVLVLNFFEELDRLLPPD